MDNGDKLYVVEEERKMSQNLRWKLEDIPLEVQERIATEFVKGEKKRSKYNVSKSTEERTVDGYIFDSIKEAEYYKNLKLLREAGEVKYFLCQIPFRLPGGVKYFCDFMIVQKSGEIRWVDTKGFFTQQSKNKIKMVEALYPVKIEIETGK